MSLLLGNPTDSRDSKKQGLTISNSTEDPNTFVFLFNNYTGIIFAGRDILNLQVSTARDIEDSNIFKVIPTHKTSMQSL